jgi:GNAT superfamily N-acetyltransferase
MTVGRQREWRRGEFTISTDNKLLDTLLIHDFISNQSYWAKGRKMETMQRALENSLNFGLYKDTEQVGFARVVTDYCTFAWLADVFILNEYRGRGLSKWLMEVILDQPALEGVRRWVLATRDAHGLYRQFDFTPMRQPERWMERFDENAR